jgi:hypothetical protein
LGIAAARDGQIALFDFISLWNTTHVPILLPVNLSTYQWPNCGVWWFLCARKQLVWVFSTCETLNHVDRRPMNFMSSCVFVLSQKARTTLKATFTNINQVHDVIQVIERGVEAEWDAGWMMTIMLHSSMHPTAYQSIWTMCQLSRVLQWCMVGCWKQ